MAADSQNERTEVVLDCTDCPYREQDACADCVVAYILDRPSGAIVFDAAEERAIRSLSHAGLLPDVRFGRKTG